MDTSRPSNNQELNIAIRSRHIMDQGAEMDASYTCDPSVEEYAEEAEHGGDDEHYPLDKMQRIPDNSSIDTSIPNPAAKNEEMETENEDSSLNCQTFYTPAHSPLNIILQNPAEEDEEMETDDEDSEDYESTYDESDWSESEDIHADLRKIIGKCLNCLGDMEVHLNGLSNTSLYSSEMFPVKESLREAQRCLNEALVKCY